MAWSLTSFRIGRAAIVASLVLVTACGARTYVDGLPVGERICPDASDWLCSELTNFAAATLDGAIPNHGPFESIELYRPDYRSLDGQPVLHLRGTAGGEAIVVFRLEDAAVHAVYVGCISGPWGEAERPPPGSVHCTVMTPMPGEHRSDRR